MSVRCGGWKEWIFFVAGNCLMAMGCPGAVRLPRCAGGARGAGGEMDRLGLGFVRGLDVCEVEERAVEQVRRRDVGERAENGFEPSGMAPFPLAQHRLHLLALEQVLRAAQVARDDGKGAQLRVGLEVA